jgi:asparagine N-glycosylation enzyme membrane subunit Stt3
VAFASLGWVGFVIGGVVSTALIGAVLLWTVAEMVEDGLPKGGSATE